MSQWNILFDIIEHVAYSLSPAFIPQCVMVETHALWQRELLPFAYRHGCLLSSPVHRNRKDSHHPFPRGASQVCEHPRLGNSNWDLPFGYKSKDAWHVFGIFGSYRCFFPCKITFIGSRCGGLCIVGSHYWAYEVRQKRFCLSLPLRLVLVCWWADIWKGKENLKSIQHFMESFHLANLYTGIEYCAGSPWSRRPFPW